LWQENPTLENASAVVDCAVAVNDPLLAVGPATMILQNRNAMPEAQFVARAVLEGPHHINLDASLEKVSVEETRRAIRKVKSRLAGEPRNGLLWLEKARLYTQIGDIQNADSALRRSLACAPNNRFVLRAYARFAVHLDDPARAHDRLKRSEGLRIDPWLQAAEMSVAELAGRKPLTAKNAQALIDQEAFGSLHLSEAAAALATLELGAGKVRNAKRLFSKSLTRPTDNSLSQALWARDDQKVNLSVPVRMLHLPGAFEARVQSATASGQWSEAVEHCFRWLEDEPFSTRAAAEGSFLATSFLWDSQKALDFCERGLVANPNDLTLLNNKLVALARAGRLREAEQVADKIRAEAEGPEPDPTIMATMGLLAFRSKKLEDGRNWYTRAVERLRSLRLPNHEFRAKCHWYYEEVNAGLVPEHLRTPIETFLDEESKRFDIHNTARQSWEVIEGRLSVEIDVVPEHTEQLNLPHFLAG
jgi:tetratricopeptide (TPR) repeat protein